MKKKGKKEMVKTPEKLAKRVDEEFNEKVIWFSGCIETGLVKQFKYNEKLKEYNFLISEGYFFNRTPFDLSVVNKAVEDYNSNGWICNYDEQAAIFILKQRI